MTNKVLLEVPVGISNHHVHLCEAHLEQLFGTNYQLTKLKDMKQIGEFAAKETITIVGPKGVLENVRVLGPVRPHTQVELSRTDCFKVGINAPIRQSGELDGTPGCLLVGPKGTVDLKQGVIIADRHIHMSTAEAKKYGLVDKDQVSVLAAGPRELCFHNVLVRVKPLYRLEMHIDTDEANAAFLNNGDMVCVLGKTESISILSA